jgi:proton glutamate symport protein
MNYQTLVKLLRNPITILISVLLGLLLGIYFPAAGAALDPYGDIYLKLLEFTLVPIIASSVTLSITRIISAKSSQDKSAMRLISIMLSFMIIVGAISFAITFLLKPAADFLSSKNLRVHEITTAASIVKRKLTETIEAPFAKPVSQFILDAIPSNIIASLAQSRTFQILVLSVILGIAMGYLPENKRMSTTRFFEIVLHVFQSIISYITLWLPIGIFCLTAASTSLVGFETISQMGPLIIKAYFIFILIFILCTLIIKFRSGQTIMNTLAFLKGPIFIAFGTRSSIAPIPSQIESLRDKFHFDKDIVDLLIPLGAVIGRFGNIAYFGFLAAFVIDLYLYVPTFTQIILIIFLLTIAGLSTTGGGSNVATLGLISIVLDPLNLPVGAIVPLLFAIDSIIDPVRTLSTVYTNCTNVALSAPRPPR